MTDIRVTFQNGATCIVDEDTAARLGPSFKRKGARSRAVRVAQPPADDPGTAGDPQPPADDPGTAGDPQPPADDAPTAEWSVAQLREFADTHSIDLGAAKKHGAILAVIEAHLAEIDDTDEVD